MVNAHRFFFDFGRFLGDIQYSTKKKAKKLQKFCQFFVFFCCLFVEYGAQNSRPKIAQNKKNDEHLPIYRGVIKQLMVSNFYKEIIIAIIT